MFAYDYQTTKGSKQDSLKIRGFRFNIISTTGCLNVVVVVHVVAFVVVVVVVFVDVVVFVVVSPTGHFILSIFEFHR